MILDKKCCGSRYWVNMKKASLILMARSQHLIRIEQEGIYGEGSRFLLKKSGQPAAPRNRRLTGCLEKKDIGCKHPKLAHFRFGTFFPDSL